jgi:UTP--glucose-1-phosphate uridylyltransferase
MLPVVDKPVIQYVIEEAHAAGIDDVLIVTGRNKRAIEDHFDRALELETEAVPKANCSPDLEAVINGTHVHYIRQKYPKGLGHAVLCGESHMAGQPFLVLLGDVIVPANDCIPQLQELHERYGCSVIAVESVEPEAVSRYGVIAGFQVAEGVWKVDDLVEKPAPQDAPSNLAIFGRYLLTPAIFKHLRLTKPGKGDEIQLTDAMKSLLAEEPMYAVELKSERFDIGNKLSWMEANVKLALKDPEMSESFRAYLRGLLCE